MLSSLDFYVKKYQILENKFLCCAVNLNPAFKNQIHCTAEEKKMIYDRAVEYIENFCNQRQSNYYEDDLNANEDENLTDLNDSFFEQDTQEPQLENERSSLETVQHEIVLYSNCKSTENCSEFWKKNSDKFINLA